MVIVMLVVLNAYWGKTDIGPFNDCNPLMNNFVMVPLSNQELKKKKKKEAA